MLTAIIDFSNAANCPKIWEVKSKRKAAAAEPSDYRFKSVKFYFSRKRNREVCISYKSLCVFVFQVARLLCNVLYIFIGIFTVYSLAVIQFQINKICSGCYSKWLLTSGDHQYFKQYNILEELGFFQRLWLVYKK